MAEEVPIKLSRSFEGKNGKKRIVLRCAHRRGWDLHGSALPGGSTVDVTEQVMGRAKTLLSTSPLPAACLWQGWKQKRRHSMRYAPPGPEIQTLI